MSEESNTHSDSPSGSVSSTLDDVSPSPSQSTCVRDSIRKVCFPEEENDLVTGYLEPPNPWKYARNVTREEVISRYESSCIRHGTEPLQRVLQQLKEVEMDTLEQDVIPKPELGERSRSEILDLKGERLGHHHCEPLEEILKRLQFQTINLEDTFEDDEASVALFDMVEYYEAAKQLNISSNNSIGPRGWQACSQMLKKTRCLEKLIARNTKLSEQLMPALCRGLRIGTHLQILHLENCNLSGRSIVILVNALKTNTALKELHLADNSLGIADALHLGALLRVNSTLQLLDISNNNFQDTGVGHICDGLSAQAAREYQSGHYRELVMGLSEVSSLENTGGGKGVSGIGSGLSVLILWNNQLTKKSAYHLYKLLANSKSLDTLNVGHNMLTSESLHIMKEALQQTRSLERLGLQSTKITCEGAIALAECIADNPHLQRIDLRDNQLQIGGLMALALSMKVNDGVTRLDLDDNPKKKMDGDREDEVLEQYHGLVKEIRDYCSRNARIAEERVREKLANCKDVENESGEKNMDAACLSPVHATVSNSRKISLTCETLLRSSAADIVANEGSNQRVGIHLGGQSLSAEPRRGLGAGARLRSPAPSPIPSPSPSPTPSPTPSPHSSPVPSPSRSRFHVSRVPESSSPASSSEGTYFLSAPPAFSSSSPIPSPGALSSTPTSGTPSRFKVTLVSEANFAPTTSVSAPEKNTSDVQSTPTVVTSSTNNITIGFEFPTEKKLEENKMDGDEVSKRNKKEEEKKEREAEIEQDDDGWNFDEPSETKVASPLSQGEVVVGEASAEPLFAVKNQTGIIIAEKVNEEKVNAPSDIVTTVPSSSDSLCPPNIRVSQSSLSPNSSSPTPTLPTKSPYSVSGRIRKFSGVIPPHNVDSEPPPRIQSSIEKLLGLFQHPGSFFGKSSNSVTQQQSTGNQPSVGVGFFFSSPSSLSITKSSSKATASNEMQQHLKNSNNNSSSSSSFAKSSPPTSFGSMILSNVMQEVSAMRSVFPGSHVCSEKPVYSLDSQSLDKLSSFPDDNNCGLNMSDRSMTLFPKLEDKRICSDVCHKSKPKNNQLQDNFPENTVLRSCPSDDECPFYSASYDNSRCAVESVPDSVMATENKSIGRVGLEHDDVDCERTTRRTSLEKQLCSIVGKNNCDSAEGEGLSGFLENTGSVTEGCVIDKDCKIPLVSIAETEKVQVVELSEMSCDLPDPNAYSNVNEEAVKSIEVEANKSWFNATEVTLNREELGQNLQLDILATCYTGQEEEKRLESDEGHAGSETSCCNTSADTITSGASLGSTPAADILSHLGGQE